MRLAFQIPGKLYWIHNFLSDSQYARIHRAVHKERKQLKYHSAMGVWDKVLITNLRPPDRILVDNIFFTFYETLLRHNPIFPIEGKLKYVIHNMKFGSGINWHDDGSYTYGLTYYLNRRWAGQWGGEFMFRTGSQCGYLPVVGNSLVIVKAPCEHKVNPVLSSIVPRITIQSFVS
tara:strand:+ start:2014 stop:2538 length:525 start_codon:yes stop_codon:yes gene_type:complete